MADGASIIPGEDFPSFFATAFHVQASVPSHMSIEFRLTTPQQEASRGAPSTVCRVYLSPVIAKQMHGALARLLSEWEGAMGAIEVPTGPDWVPPMRR